MKKPTIMNAWGGLMLLSVVVAAAACSPDDTSDDPEGDGDGDGTGGMAAGTGGSGEPGAGGSGEPGTGGGSGDPCVIACETDVGLTCPNDGTLEECLASCATLDSGDCLPEANAYIQCALGEPPSSFECDEDGETVLGSDYCVSQSDAWAECLLAGPLIECGTSGEAIPLDWVCDGVSDCPDGAEEIGCTPCSDGSSSVPAEWLCDGVTDCDDGSDESSC